MNKDLMKVVDALINDDQEAAQSAFHSYVVQRSATIVTPSTEENPTLPPVTEGEIKEIWTKYIEDVRIALTNIGHAPEAVEEVINSPKGEEVLFNHISNTGNWVDVKGAVNDLLRFMRGA